MQQQFLASAPVPMPASATEEYSLADDKVILNIGSQYQQASNWCWAACVSMCASYYYKAKYPGQCAVAHDLLKLDCCHPIPGPCNVDINQPRLVDAFNAARLNAVYSGPIPLNRILHQIGVLFRPIVIGFALGPSGHLVVINGYWKQNSQSDPLLSVLDPAMGSLWYRWTEIENGLYGEWKATFTDISER
jgi:papain like cysteine protease AvrRpt2